MASRSSDRREIVESVADTEVPISEPSRRRFLVTGTAAMFGLILPDARTLQLGSTIVVENASANCIGVRNSDSSVFARVPPYGTFYGTIMGQATGPGVWRWGIDDPAKSDPKFGMSIVYDFLDVSSTGAFIGLQAAGGNVPSGTGAGVSMYTNGVLGHPGIIVASTGTGTAGWSLAYSGGTNVNYIGGNCCQAIEALVSLSAESTAGQEYSSGIFIGNNVAGAPHTEGIGLLCDRLTFASSTWRMRNITAAGNETVDSGILPAFGTGVNDWQKVRVEVTHDRLRTDFFVGAARVSPVGGLTTHIPADSTALKPIIFGITKSAGSTSRFLRLDYVHLQSYPTVLR